MNLQGSKGPDLTDHCKDAGFYSERHSKPPKVSEQSDDMT